MSFFKENPGPLSIYFMLIGGLGALGNFMEIVELKKISADIGLSGVGSAYYVIAHVFFVVCVALVISGLLFKRILRSAPWAVTWSLWAVIALKVIVTIMIPDQIIKAAISLVIVGYLLAQYNRLMRESKEPELVSVE
jgi:hypothetical protein